MNEQQMVAFFSDRASRGVPMVLVTVIETAGSTYSKAGAQMLVDGDGLFCGMLSGGCLEGDLAERAQSVIAEETPQHATYELDADDELFGLGVGCEGTMRVVLQPLLKRHDYQPFATLSAVKTGHRPAATAMLVDSETPGLVVGSMAIANGSHRQLFGISEEIADELDLDVAGLKTVTVENAECRVLCWKTKPMPALLVMGAGLDSEPLVSITTSLGWRCTVVDHRSAYVNGRRYPPSIIKRCIPVAELSASLDLSLFDMAMVMSHHLASDRAYLQQLARTDVGYVGLLGPPGRRDRLLSEMGDAAALLESRLHGPAGFDLGGRGPGPIAVSIAAEMQEYLGGLEAV